MTAQRLLVTGGSGFIGTNLVADRGQRGGCEVLNIDLRPPRVPGGTFEQVDILDLRSLKESVDRFQPTHVVHLAARTDLDGRTPGDYAVNTTGTENLLEALRTAGSSPRLVLASSRMVCPIGYVPQTDTDFRPPNAYGASKMEMEKVIRRQAPPASWTIVRPTSIWGPWFSVPYADFFKHVLAGRYIHPSGVRVDKHFGFVENTVHQISGILDAPDAQVAGRVLYLADYEPIEVLTFARQLAAAAGAPTVREVPRWVLAAFAGVGDALKRSGLMASPPLTTFRLENLCTNMTFDLSATRDIAPALPFTWEQGIARTLNWLRSPSDGSRVA